MHKRKKGHAIKNRLQEWKIENIVKNQSKRLKMVKMSTERLNARKRMGPEPDDECDPRVANAPILRSTAEKSEKDSGAS